ncbi:hypothetical protein HC891_20735 [Candidatus Gracilibacteria bacterium]|nr:hypothetical protein [Candidatus Gracilibacteria bacterium]
MAKRTPKTSQLLHPDRSTPWRLPEQLVQRGTKLLTQQCWYWGCDVRRTNGNLLLEHGFSRVRPPTGTSGSSIYQLETATGAHLVVWSFGVFYREAAGRGVFLDRFRFDPYLLDNGLTDAAVFQIEQLPPRRKPGDSDVVQLIAQLADLIGCVIAYEQRIIAEYGLHYREQCLAQWTRQKLALPVDTFLASWDCFRRDLASIRCVG